MQCELLPLPFTSSILELKSRFRCKRNIDHKEVHMIQEAMGSFLVEKTSSLLTMSVSGTAVHIPCTANQIVIGHSLGNSFLFYHNLYLAMLALENTG